MDERCSKCTETPQEECSTEGFPSPEASDGQGPGELKQKGAETRQRVDIAKLASLEPDVSIEAEDSSISKLVSR